MRDISEAELDEVLKLYGYTESDVAIFKGRVELVQDKESGQIVVRGRDISKSHIGMRLTQRQRGQDVITDVMTGVWSKGEPDIEVLVVCGGRFVPLAFRNDYVLEEVQ